MRVTTTVLSMTPSLKRLLPIGHISPPPPSPLPPLSFPPSPPLLSHLKRRWKIGCPSCCLRAPSSSFATCGEPMAEFCGPQRPSSPNKRGRMWLADQRVFFCVLDDEIGEGRWNCSGRGERTPISQISSIQRREDEDDKYWDGSSRRWHQVLCCNGKEDVSSTVEPRHT